MITPIVPPSACRRFGAARVRAAPQFLVHRAFLLRSSSCWPIVVSAAARDEKFALKSGATRLKFSDTHQHDRTFTARSRATSLLCHFACSGRLLPKHKALN